LAQLPPARPTPAALPAPAKPVPLSPPPIVPRATDWTFPSPEIAAPQALVARLSDEVRRGHVARPAPSLARGLLLTALALALAGAAALVTYRATHRGASHASAPAETLPAGTERVMPADIGTTGAAAPAISGTGIVASPDAGASGASAAGQNAAPEQQPAGDAPQAAESAPALPPASKAQGNLAGLTYEVHVASFKTDGEAQDLVERLHGRGLDAWYAKATDQRNWYRVFIGHYATHKEAARRAKSLLNRGQVEHAIAFPDHAR
jgi:septal ring-binding cell division protein DamX